MQPPDQPAPGEPNPVPPQIPPDPSTSSSGSGDTPPPNEPGSDSSKDDRSMAMIAHLGGVITCFIAPLIVWLIRKDQPGFTEDQAKEALNFQITVAIAYVVWAILSAVPLLGCLIAPLGVVIFLASLVLSIVGGVKANEGFRYRYPVTLRLIQ